MKVLVVGSGGREHAFVWKIAQSPKVSKIYALPGNGGMAQLAECVEGIDVTDTKAIADFAEQNKVELTVVGPELPLSVGLVDVFIERGLKVFGPSKAAARIEGSKSFSKEIMEKGAVPTAKAGVFEDEQEALSFLDQNPAPIVVKADGLAAGKGVIIAQTTDEAKQAVRDFLGGNKFGQAGKRIVIEEFLSGEEASFFALCDGKDFIDFGTSQDHKRAFDADRGPNTGGMGAYSPAFLLTDGDEQVIREKVIRPTLDTMQKEGCPYTGFLYGGLMMDKGVPLVLEFNARMGDPETQVVLPRLENDLVEVIEAALEGRLGELEIKWDPRPAVTVVMASGGYPGSYEKGCVISGVEKANALEDVTVFHAGTTVKDGKLVTSGGRVLAVTALGDDLTQAVKKAYQAVSLIDFDNVHFRKDIAYRALKSC